MKCGSTIPDQTEGANPPGAAPAPRTAGVQRALNESGYRWLQRVVVVAEGEDIVLRGTVPSYHLKQLAQATALTVSGVGVVRNEVEVEDGR